MVRVLIFHGYLALSLPLLVDAYLDNVSLAALAVCVLLWSVLSFCLMKWFPQVRAKKAVSKSDDNV
jgi:hypothetical protein